MNRFLSLAGASLLGALAPWCGSLGATSTATATAGDTGLEDIVVTAEKRDSTVQATAISTP